MEEDEDRGVPCCVADAARGVTKIRVDGNLIGIMEFESLMWEVRYLGPLDDAHARAELIERAKVYNYIPPTSEDDYANALLIEFRKRYKEYR